MPTLFGVLLLATLPQHGRGYGEAPKYLIVSAPSTRRIAYLKLPSGGPIVAGEQMRTLIATGLSVPQGIAVDQYRKKLYVADPDLNKLVSYDIVHSGDGLTVGAQQVVASGVESRWVTVDGIGNVYFTDEAKNRVYKVSAQSVESGTPTADIIYDSGSSVISSPGGIATDNFFVYWVNKASGMQVGTLIRATETPNITISPTIPSVTKMTNNVMKSYGVCLAGRNIFYTDEQSSMYAVVRTGGTPKKVTASLQEPRGCAYDGEGTVYVADKSLNAVYQFAANSDAFTTATSIHKAVDFQGAFGVSVYTRIMS